MNDIEHADALDWLRRQEPGSARAIVFDPPYAVHAGPRPGGRRRRVDVRPVRFLHQTLGMCARA